MDRHIEPEWLACVAEGQLWIVYDEPSGDIEVGIEIEDAVALWPGVAAWMVGSNVPIKQPKIVLLPKPTKSCWWLVRDGRSWNGSYGVNIAKPVCLQSGMWCDDRQHTKILCDNICSRHFHMVYPHAKLRARTCKPIAPIKLVRI